MAQRQACQQTRFAVASRLALDREPDLAPAILRHAAVNRFNELTLARQQLHFTAGVNSFRHRQTLKKGDDAIDAA